MNNNLLKSKNRVQMLNVYFQWTYFNRFFFSNNNYNNIVLFLYLQIWRVCTNKFLIKLQAKCVVKISKVYTLIKIKMLFAK